MATTLVLDYGDGSPLVTTPIPEGTGQQTFMFQHGYHAQGRYDGTHYDQTFTELAAIAETGAYSYATTEHVC